MAFPIVQSITPTAFGSNTTAHLVSMPATVTAGELLLCLFANDGGATVTTPGGWTELFSTANANNRVRASAHYRIADGTEDGTTVDFVTSASEEAAAQVYRITGWEGTGAGIEATGGAQATSVNPNPPSETASWGADDNLWIAHVGFSSSATVSSYSANYSDGTFTESSGGGTSTGIVASARRELNAATDDPGTYTLSASSAWAAGTIVVRPVSAPAGAVSLVPDGGAHVRTIIRHPVYRM